MRPLSLPASCARPSRYLRAVSTMDARTAVEPGERRHLVVELEQEGIRQFPNLGEAPLGAPGLDGGDGDAADQTGRQRPRPAPTASRFRLTNFQPRSRAEAGRTRQRASIQKAFDFGAEGVGRG